MATILLVEGGPRGSSSMESALKKADLIVFTVYSANKALSWVEHNAPDLVVVNATSMRSSGIRTSRRLRKYLGDVPIIHCRKVDQPLDDSACADIYLAQPFTPRKLLNRIRALLPADDSSEEVIRAGDITFYLSKRSIDVAGKGEKKLTPKLADLMMAFLRHQNEVLSRKQLMKDVWDTNYFGDTRTLDVHIRWMREVIEENPAKPKLLKTVRGVGYIFCIRTD